MRNHLKIEYPQ